MKEYAVFWQCLFFLAIINPGNNSFCTGIDTVPPRHQVTLGEAHIGNLEIDTKLLDSYRLLPNNIRTFYLQSRTVFEGSPEADFNHANIIEAARKNNIPLMGGPMLGDLTDHGVMIWMRPSTTDPFVVKVTTPDSSSAKSYVSNSLKPGLELRIQVNGLVPDREYRYAIYSKNERIAEGGFTTAPAFDEKGIIKLVFGSCFHKIGLHNPNLIEQILKREPRAMLLLGDIAVDDRNNRINMHRSDYLLRDVSKPWQQLSANVPLYAAWDDHDYFDNDLGGIPEGYTEEDRTAVRDVWHQNWNNPENPNPGIYFNTRIGPAEVIMLDTRSLRENARRGEYGSYLGMEQFNWLKKTLKNSDAPFKVISSGTMWSDFITNGKDSWGTWDTQAREELFDFIEKENITGVLLISGDRHGARGFTVSRPSGCKIYEFQVASLGGVEGPDAMAKDTTNQLFGYHGAAPMAFGEFTFNSTGDNPLVTFRLINEFGAQLEEYVLPYYQSSLKYPILFYSGRNGDQDIYIQYPGDHEPVNVTNHPAKDNCPTVSPDGKKIAFLSDRDGYQNVYSMNIDGSEVRQLTATNVTMQHPEWAGDGTKLLYVKDFSNKTEVWVMNSDGTGQKQLTANHARDERPFLSPDESKILFMSNRDGNYEIYTMNADGTNQTRLTHTPYLEIFPAWSPDGKHIAYAKKELINGVMQGGIHIMNADGSDDREITGQLTRDENPVWSPDGKYIAFQNVRDGNFEIYVMNADGTNPVRITNHPAWDGWASFIPIKAKTSSDKRKGN